MSLGCFLRGAWPFVASAVDGQGKGKREKFSLGQCWGVRKRKAVPLKQKPGEFLRLDLLGDVQV